MGKRRSPKNDPDGYTGVEASLRDDSHERLERTVSELAHSIYGNEAASVMYGDSERVPLVQELEEMRQLQSSQQVFVKREKNSGSSSSSNNVNKKGNEFGLPEDSYSFIILSTAREFAFHFGIFVWIIQVFTMLLFFTDQVDPNAGRNKFLIPGNIEWSVRISQAIAIIISVVFAGASLSDLLTSVELLFIIKPDKTAIIEDTRFFHRLCLQAALRFIQGLLGIVVTTLLIIQSDTVFNLVLDFTAVAFVSQLDDVAYDLSSRKYFGETLLLKAEEVENNEFPKGYTVKRNPKPLGIGMQYWRFLLVAGIGLAMFVIYFLTTAKQVNGFFLCKQLQVEFGDNVMPQLGSYNGVYDLIDGEFSDRGRVIYEQNLGTTHDGRLGYCEDTDAWTLYPKDSSDPCDFIVRSSETRSFEIESTSTELWFTPDGRPIEYNKLRCLAYSEDEKIDTKTLLPATTSDECTQVFFDVSSITDNFALIFSFNQIFEILPGIKSHGQSVFRAKVRRPKQLDYYELFPLDDDDFWDSFWDDDYDDDDFWNDDNGNNETRRMKQVESRRQLEGEGQFVCHSWFNPLTGKIDKTSVAVSDTSWETDTEGCCDGVCRKTNNQLAGEEPTYRPWFPWAAGIDVEEVEVVSPYAVNDDWEVSEFYHGIADYEYPEDDDDGNVKDQPESNDDAPCSGLNAYFIFSGRRWIHVITASEDICNGDFHAGFFLSNTTGYTVTHVSEEIEDGSPKQNSPGGLTWYLADNRRPEYPAADLRNEVDTPIVCADGFTWGGVLQVGNRLPPYLSRLSVIDSLDLSGLELEGTIPTEIGLMTALTYMSLRRNKFSGELPKEFGNLTALEYLNLNNNFMQTTLPTEFSKLTALEHLHLYSTDLSGELPVDVFNSLTSLRSLSLGGVFQGGTLPTEIGTMTDLTSLVVAISSMTGSIPTEIGLMTSLELLAISYADMTGQIPSEIGQLTNLEFLDFSNTPFGGTLPTEIGNMAALRGLVFWNNFLTGTIPTEIGELENLYRLDFDDNVLTGTIPTEIVQLENLGVLYFRTNQLSGEFPQELCKIPRMFLNNQKEGTLFECFPDSECFFSDGVGIPDCTCHPSCMTCGYDIKPTTAENCQSCPEGFEINLFDVDDAGLCEPIELNL